MALAVLGCVAAYSTLSSAQAPAAKECAAFRVPPHRFDKGKWLNYPQPNLVNKVNEGVISIALPDGWEPVGGGTYADVPQVIACR